MLRDGESGLTFDPRVPGKLAWALQQEGTRSCFATSHGHGAQQLIPTHAHTYHAERLVEAAKLALDRASEGPVRLKRRGRP